MDAIILQENIEGLLSLVRMLLPGGGSAGCVYLDDLSALQRSIHEKINDLYSQRGETPEQDATLCLAILQGYNVSMYANSYLPSVMGCRNCVKSTETFLFVNENTTTF